MPYNFETRLNMAVKNLHALGSKKGMYDRMNREGDEQQQRISSAVGTVSNAMRKKGPTAHEKDLKARGDSDAVQPDQADVDAIRYGNPNQMDTSKVNWGDQKMNPGQLSLEDSAAMADRNRTVNGAARETNPTPEWLDRYAEEAKIDGGNINKSRQLMKYGGMLGSQVPIGPATSGGF